MKKDFYLILNTTKFPYLWFSQIFSQITINMMNFLLLIKLFEKTSSTLATSLLWVSYALPVILVGPFASAIVDLIDRKKILFVTNLLQALVVLYYAIYFDEKIFLAYGVSFFYSLLNQFYVPSENASISFLVNKDMLPRANGMFYITQQLSLITGFALASVVNQLLGFNTSLFICSFFLFAATISTAFLPKMKVSEEDEKGVEETLLIFFKSIYEGYKFIRSEKNILITFSILIIVQVFFSIIVVSVPKMADEILKIDPGLSGLLIVIPAGIGSLLGALNIPSFLRNGWRKRKLIETSLFVLSILIVVEALFINYIPYMANVVVSAVIIFFIGIFFTGIIIPSQTFLQEKTPDQLKGRIFGNMWFITTIFTIIPVIFSGVLTEVFGIKFILLMIAVICMLMYYFSRQRAAVPAK